ncbi:MAG: hypothetical protein HW386_1210 [Gammaproteobacteria bacterium]|nr:hypothetical protein [Gammaproteobacteria bacterium]
MIINHTFVFGLVTFNCFPVVVPVVSPAAPVPKFLAAGYKEFPPARQGVFPAPVMVFDPGAYAIAVQRN